MKIKEKKTPWLILGLTVLILLLSVTGLILFRNTANYGFSREIPDSEKTMRLKMVSEAESWLGTKESSAEHEKILQIYNSHKPLAQGYEVTPDDNWCAAFASTVAIQCGNTHIIPTECGCQRQIDLWQEMGRWEERDSYVPLPGDFIYYAWDEGWSPGDCTAWADHVGIVVGTAGPFLKVIEGNYADQVSCRIILLNNFQIRGYGLPDYR